MEHVCCLQHTCTHTHTHTRTLKHTQASIVFLVQANTHKEICSLHPPHTQTQITGLSEALQGPPPPNPSLCLSRDNNNNNNIGADSASSLKAFCESVASCSRRLCETRHMLKSHPLSLTAPLRSTQHSPRSPSISIGTYGKGWSGSSTFDGLQKDQIHISRMSYEDRN